MLSHNHLLQSLQLGEEIRFVSCQRIGRVQSRKERARSKGHLVGTHRRTDRCQYEIHPYCTQISAFTGHIGSGDNQE